MKQRLIQVSKEMGDVELAIKLMAVLADVPFVIILCTALGWWIGAHFDLAIAGVFCGCLISIPLWMLSVYGILVAGHKKKEVEDGEQ